MKHLSLGGIEVLQRVNVASTWHSMHISRRIYLTAGRRYSHHRVRHSSLDVLPLVMRHTRSAYGVSRDAARVLGHAASLGASECRSHRRHFVCAWC